MTEHSRTNKLLADIKNNFRKLGLELDTLPPVLQGNASIPTHTDGLFVNACQLVAHATRWTELALKWLNKHQAGEVLYQPEAGYDWGGLDELSLLYYEKQNTEPFKDSRARFNNSYIQLIDRITDNNDAPIWAAPLHDNLTIGQMLHRHISELYVEDHFRIRVWKKSLGWV